MSIANLVHNSETSTETLARDRDLADAAIREIVGRALNGCKKQLAREQLAARLTEETGQHITKSMLDDWASPSKKSLRFPASLVKPLCEITGSDEMQRVLMGPRLRPLVELGEQIVEMRDTVDQVQAKIAKLLSPRRRRAANRSRRK